jgi:PPOX class probable F420-dependent enzyme
VASLDVSRCQALVADAKVARLATVTVDGKPHVVPCCFALAADRSVAWSAVDGKPKSTAALRRLDNIAANPAAALLVDHYADDWSELWWVRVDGSAAVVTDEVERGEALDLLAERYPQYRAARPEGPVIRLTLQRWSGWAYT